MLTKNISSQRRLKKIVMVDVGQQTPLDANKKIVSTSVSKKPNQRRPKYSIG